MDYFEEGKSNQKLFGSINNGYEFEQAIKRIDNEYDAANFVRGLLDKTKNETLFIRAKQVARKFEKNQSIWGAILYAFNQLIRGKTKPKWAFGFVSSTIEGPDLNLHNFDVEKLVYMIYNYDGENSGWWFGKMSQQSWFEEYKPYMKNAILKAADKFDNVAWQKNVETLNHFKDMYFYRQLMDKTNSPRFFEAVIHKLKVSKRDIEGFYGGFEIDDLMKTYPKQFSQSANSMNYLTDLIKEFWTPDTGKLFVELLTKTGYTEESNRNWLFKIADINSDAVQLNLYEITGKEEYLPQTAKDVFLF